MYVLCLCSFITLVKEAHVRVFVDEQDEETFLSCTVKVLTLSDFVVLISLQYCHSILLRFIKSESLFFVNFVLNYNNNNNWYQLLTCAAGKTLCCIYLFCVWKSIIPLLHLFAFFLSFLWFLHHHDPAPEQFHD